MDYDEQIARQKSYFSYPEELEDSITKYQLPSRGPIKVALFFTSNYDAFVA